MRLPALILVAALHSMAAMAAESVPEAVIADPPTDARFPARMEVIHVPSGGVQISAPAIDGITSTHLTGSPVYVGADGRLGVSASSERYKTGIVPMGGSTQKLHERRRRTSLRQLNGAGR
jgi:hypothetical protein